MKTPKATGKRKTKKTIGKMTPLARKLEHLKRSLWTLLIRLSFIQEEVQRVEVSERAANKALDDCLGRKVVVPPLYPEPPDGEGVLSDIENVLGTTGAGYHSGSDADPRD
jgi:hypothetical protein